MSKAKQDQVSELVTEAKRQGGVAEILEIHRRAMEQIARMPLNANLSAGQSATGANSYAR